MKHLLYYIFVFFLINLVVLCKKTSYSSAFFLEKFNISVDLLENNQYCIYLEHDEPGISIKIPYPISMGKYYLEKDKIIFKDIIFNFKLKARKIISPYPVKKNYIRFIEGFEF